MPFTRRYVRFAELCSHGPDEPTLSLLTRNGLLEGKLRLLTARMLWLWDRLYGRPPRTLAHAALGALTASVIAFIIGRHNLQNDTLAGIGVHHETPCYFCWPF